MFSSLLIKVENDKKKENALKIKKDQKGHLSIKQQHNDKVQIAFENNVQSGRWLT